MEGMLWGWWRFPHQATQLSGPREPASLECLSAEGAVASEGQPVALDSLSLPQTATGCALQTALGFSLGLLSRLDVA